LQREGVALHAVTAETGGDSAVKGRLADRDTVLSYPVHSDPEHKLLLPDKDGGTSLYVKKQQDASKYGGSYTDYMMVQPALIVVNKKGALQQVWSWNTPPLDSVEPKVEMTPVPTAGGRPLVGVRPTSSDLLPSIIEGRNVSLSGKTIPQIMLEKVGSGKVMAGLSCVVLAISLYAYKSRY